MDRRPQRVGVGRRVTGAKRRPAQQGHVVQFLLLASVGALLVGSIATCSVYNNRASWKKWAASLYHDGGSSEDRGDDLEDRCICYLGGGYAALGEFSIGRYDSITNTTLTVEFLLKGMTPCEDKASFITFMRANEGAFRDRVTETMQECRIGDYADAVGMGKKVVARVNRAFSQRFLESAELVDFAVYESVGTYQAQAWEPGGELVAAQE